MTEYGAKFWSILAGPLVLWIAIAGVLAYNHHLLMSEHLPAALRSQKELPLYVCAALFVAFNAVMTILRLQQLRRSRPPLDATR